jgi:hypothetical protein
MRHRRLHPVLTVPLACDQILKDSEPRSTGKLYEVVEPGDWFSPPFLVYAPDVENLLHLQKFVPELYGFWSPLVGDDFYRFWLVEREHEVV